MNLTYLDTPSETVTELFQKNGWTLRMQDLDQLSLLHETGLRLDTLRPALTLKNGEALESTTWKTTFSMEGGCHVFFTHPSSLTLELIPHSDAPEGYIAFRATLRNHSPKSIAIETLSSLATQRIHSPIPLTHAFRHGQHLCDPTVLQPLSGPQESYDCAAYTDSAGQQALLLGFEDLSSAVCRIEAQTNNTTLASLQATVQREGIAIPPQSTLSLPRLLIGAGESLLSLMRRYAKQVAETMDARTGAVKTGWCSWYYYYGTETQEDILQNTAQLAESPLADKLEVIQIDDGWNIREVRLASKAHTKEDADAMGEDNALKTDSQRVWGDWHAGVKFPQGMKHAADAIRAQGFSPGLWLAPFSVDKASNLRQDHPEWLVQDDDGPAEFWGVHALDLTHPEALHFIHETFTRVFDEWGYDYVKLDFLLHAIQRGKRFDPTLTTAQAYRQGMQVIRDVAGDRFVLCCGAPMGPSIGLCDAMRIGYDVSSQWFVPMNLENWPWGNCNIKAAATHTLWRQWMHQIWWQNDPDCLMVRDYGSEPELDALHSGSSENYGLSDEEAGCWMRLIWLTGGMTLLSELPWELSPERRMLLQQAFPLNDAPAQVVDWYENANVTLLKSDSAMLHIGLFNLGDASETVTIPRAKLGLPDSAIFSERFSREHFAMSGETIAFPPLPPHSGRIWELKRY